MANEISMVLHTDAVLKKFSKPNQRKYVGALQLGLVEYMAITRIGAIGFIIPNSSGSKMPWRASRIQPSVQGRLTSRTGRMIAGLREGGNASQQRGLWKGFGNRIVRSNPSRYGTLNGLVRATVKGASIDHVGTYTIYVRDNSQALNKKPHGVRPATKAQITLRYRWETGIRGGRRQYMTPSALKNIRYLKQQVEMHTSQVIRSMK